MYIVCVYVCVSACMHACVYIYIRIETGWGNHNDLNDYTNVASYSIFTL